MKIKYLFLILAIVGLLLISGFSGCGDKKATTGYVTYSGQYGQPAAGQQQYPVAGCGIAAPSVADEPVSVNSAVGL